MPRFTFGPVLAVSLALLSASVTLAQSQASTGVIEGTVVDESKAIVPGASVTIKNTDTNFKRVVTTDKNGRFRGLLLPLGRYQVSVSLQGFSTAVRAGIDLGVGQTVNLPLTLKLSSLQAEVLVTADAPVIETARTEGATRVDSQSIKGLPNNGRNFFDFTILTPGVSIVQGPDGAELSVNGQKGIQNNVSVDGADFNNPFFGEQRGGQRPAFTFNMDAIKEVVVVAEGANAEFGRSNGGFVNVVTKSGTNATHGTTHLFFKNDALSTAPKKADGTTGAKFDFSQLQTGFTLGGPIKKDQAFYFLALDYQKGTSTKQASAARIEPRLVDFFSRLGSPNENGPIDRTNDARVFLAKADWQASAKHLLTLRYNYTWSEQKNGTFDVDSWGTSANAVEKSYSHSVTGSALSSLSTSMLNEFRFQWAREDRPRPYGGPNVTGQNRPLPDTAFDFGRSYRFGMPFFIPVEYFDERIQFNENLSVIKGQHSMKFGAEFNRVHSNQTFLGFANGRYIFDSTDGFLNYARNPKSVTCSNGSSSETGSCPAGTSITGPLLLFLQQAGVGGLSVNEAGTQDIPQTEVAVFAQDRWQPNRNLTIQYGVRWEMQKQPGLITPISSLFYKDLIGKTAKGQSFPGDGTIPSDYKMFQPRVGIAWDPKGDGKTVVRLNGGIFYGRIPGLSLASSRSTDGSRGQTLFRASFFNGFGVTPPTYPNLIPQAQIGSPDHPDVFVFDKSFQNPRTLSGSIGIEREIAPNLGLLVQYNHAKGEHITRFLNGNDALLGSPWSTGLGADKSNGIGTLTVVSSNAKSSYDALTLGLTKRISSKFQGQVNYTLSRDKSDDDNERDPFTFRYAKVTNLAAEYGLSDRDQTHRLNGYFLWQAPGNVNVNVRYSYRSAQPLDLGANGKPAGTPADRIRSDGSVVTRNTGRKDNVFSALDLRLAREFKTSGKIRIEPIVEVFNLLNSRNLLAPQTTNLIFNFDGTVRAGLGDPRQAQMGLRVIW